MAAPTSGLAPDQVIRTGGYFAKYQGQWFESPQSLNGYGSYPYVLLKDPASGDTRKVSPAEVSEAALITAQGQWQGVWFGIGSLWTASGERIDQTTVSSGRDVSVVLFYGDRDPDGRVASLPGVTVLDDRGTNGGITATVPVGELTGYEEFTEVLSP